MAYFEKRRRSMMALCRLMKRVAVDVSAGCSVASRLTPRCLRPPDDVLQVGHSTGQPVDAGDYKDVTGAQELQQGVQLFNLMTTLGRSPFKDPPLLVFQEFLLIHHRNAKLLHSSDEALEGVRFKFSGIKVLLVDNDCSQEW
jgi:hypothetical protein